MGEGVTMCSEKSFHVLDLMNLLLIIRSSKTAPACVSSSGTRT